jgi:hypothetical protein
MWWRREWVYQLRWVPGHSGVLDRGVDSVAKLRAVVEWARSNPHVEKCSNRMEYRIDGAQISECPAGHALSAPAPWQPYRREQKMRLVTCRDCPGHYVTVCPTCGTRCSTRRRARLRSANRTTPGSFT